MGLVNASLLFTVSKVLIFTSKTLALEVDSADSINPLITKLSS